jgi:uncharacterized protein YjbJ (UPF0337 family)
MAENLIDLCPPGDEILCPLNLSGFDVDQRRRLRSCDGFVRCVVPRVQRIRLVGRCEMDWNVIEGNWKQTRGKIKEKWGKLTDDDLTKINGQREQLEGILQQRYGLAKDMVRKDVDAWLKSLP